jgi:hypothetical protein
MNMTYELWGVVERQTNVMSDSAEAWIENIEIIQESRRLQSGRKKKCVRDGTDENEAYPSR